MSTQVVPDINVEVTLLRSEAGGRRGPILQGEYRGVLGVGSENFSVRFFIDAELGFAPGQNQHLGVQFLVPELALPHFSVGTEFTVWEGRTIGYGRVSEVLRHA